jgi:hypothetical protein
MKRKTPVKYYKIKTRKVQSVCCSVRVDISVVIMVREEGKVEMHYSRAHPSSSANSLGLQPIALAEVNNV